MSEMIRTKSTQKTVSDILSQVKCREKSRVTWYGTASDHLITNEMIAAVDRRDAELLALEVLDVLDDFRANHQKIDALLEQDENRFHRQSLHDATERADEGRRERYISVEHRHRAEPRIDLNELDLQSFISEEAFRLSDIIRRVRVAPAGEGDTDFLALRAEHARQA